MIVIPPRTGTTNFAPVSGPSVPEQNRTGTAETEWNRGTGGTTAGPQKVIVAVAVAVAELQD